jgi:hypothetical protein
VSITLTADQLRQVAAQVDAYTALVAAGANHIPTGTPIIVDEKTLAHLWWWDDGQQYEACFGYGKSPQ